MSMIAAVSALVLLGTAQDVSPCVAVLSGGLQAAGQATTPAQDDPTAADLGSVTVTGRRTTQQQAEAFVDAVATAPAGARLARWSAPLCVSVAGLRAPYGQAMVDRIAATALDLGLQVGEPGCTPNVLIVATGDGPGTAQALVEGWRRRFRPPVDNSNMGLAALERFRTSDAPVRWWHISAPVSVDDGSFAGRVSGQDAPTVAVRNVSRMRSQIRYDMRSVTAVLDLNRASQVSLPALIDYTAMVVLAQVDPRSDYSGQATVLNLFQDRAGVQGLTDWDRDYLKALYTARPDRGSAASQEAEVANALVRTRRGENPLPVAPAPPASAP